MSNEDQIPGAEMPPIETQAMVVRDPAAPRSTTPEQAKIDAIADLTKSAYAKASELKLTPEEIAGLQKEFPDEAFKPGAAGKENLIYIEHAYLRDRLNEVLGVGQWSIVPRSRWGEDFTIPAKERGKPDIQACRIYVEAMLLIRGCFVAEAVGDMVYYKNNQSQNYGDAVEGAKTAALRRCAKELGVGLQAWKKDWCAGWWARQRGAGRSGGSQGTTQPPPTQPTRQSASPRPQNAGAPPVPKEATDDQWQRFIKELVPIRDSAVDYFKKKGWLTGDNAVLEELPKKHVPTTKREHDSLMAELEAYMAGDQKGTDWWREVQVPFGQQQGVKLADLDKKKLWGWWMNYEVEEEYNGHRKSEEEIARLNEFRQALDAAGEHYEFESKQ